MQAGRLSERIEIYKPEYEINSFGERMEEYMFLRSTKAHVISGVGKRVNSNDEIVHEYTKTFKIRRYVPISEVHQIHYKGNKYRIVSIDDNRAQNEKTIITELINE